MRSTRKYGALADLLLQALAHYDQPQQWLADQVFVSQGAVSAWINGQRRPAPDHLGHIAALLDLDVAELAILALYDTNSNAHNKLLAAYTSWHSVG